MKITLPAYAKINLTLEVLGKRDDGYHDIMSFLQTINLADTLTFELSKSIEIRFSDASLESTDNLVFKAAQLLRNETGYAGGASIYLLKRIPIAAGLGSGSTDAAATLMGLNELWNLNLPLERLSELAAMLGSDVVFFLYGGTVLAQGRGELITRLPPLPETWLLLTSTFDKTIPNKTAQLYAKLNQSHFTGGQFTKKLIESLRSEYHINDNLLYNVFEGVAFDFFNRITDQRSHLIKAGVQKVHLAGSGPALFTFVSDKEHGEVIRKNCIKAGLYTHLIHTIQPTSL